MRDGECVHRVFVAEEVEDVVPAAPGQAAQAQWAGLVGADEDRLRRCGAGGRRDLVESVDGGDLAVVERVGGFPVGDGDDGGEVVLAQDGAAKDLVALLHPGARERHDLVLDDIEEAGR